LDVDSGETKERCIRWGPDPTPEGTRLQSVRNAAARLVKAKFHYASWFGASSEPASVMEFGFNWHTTQRAHHAGVEVTPLVVSSSAYHVQGRHHCPQMSKRPCSSVLSNDLQYTGQRRTGMRSASAAVGSSEVANCNHRPVVQCRWTTSLVQSTCYCSRHYSVVRHVTKSAPVGFLC